MVLFVYFFFFFFFHLPFCSSIFSSSVFFLSFSPLFFLYIFILMVFHFKWDYTYTHIQAMCNSIFSVRLEVCACACVCVCVWERVDCWWFWIKSIFRQYAVIFRGMYVIFLYGIIYLQPHTHTHLHWEYIRFVSCSAHK